jgi:small-conductance mechanosensitive channel
VRAVNVEVRLTIPIDYESTWLDLRWIGRASLDETDTHPTPEILEKVAPGGCFLSGLRIGHADHARPIIA